MVYIAPTSVAISATWESCVEPKSKFSKNGLDLQVNLVARKILRYLYPKSDSNNAETPGMDIAMIILAIFVPCSTLVDPAKGLTHIERRTRLKTDKRLVCLGEFVVWVVDGVRAISKGGLADNIESYLAH